jgi:hypothetical protein
MDEKLTVSRDIGTRLKLNNNYFGKLILKLLPPAGPYFCYYRLGFLALLAKFELQQNFVRQSLCS